MGGRAGGIKAVVVNSLNIFGRKGERGERRIREGGEEGEGGEKGGRMGGTEGRGRGEGRKKIGIYNIYISQLQTNKFV